MTRTERRKAYFAKQKAFFKSFSGTVLVNDTLIRCGNGLVIDAEVVESYPADIVVTDDYVEFRDRKNQWADNPTLVEEFVSRISKFAPAFL